MSKKINWIITDNNITVNWEGQTHIEKRGTGLADQIVEALREGRHDEIPNLIDASKRLPAMSQGLFTVKDGQVFVKGVAAPRVLGDKIVKFSKEFLPVEPLLKFAENLQSNPSFRAVQELYTFLEKNDHAITQDGNFIAYKRVRADFKDIHTGTFDNSPGQVCEMPRNQVNENPNETCSNGLHVANWDYAHTQYANLTGDTSGHMLEVEVNPADVVSIPVDYNNSKMRVCKYRVIGVVTTPYTGPSLRRTDVAPVETRQTDGFSSANNDEKEPDEIDSCPECGAYQSIFDGVCEVCDYEVTDDDSCQACGEVGCEGECADEDEDEDEDSCDYCGETDCYGECEDEDEDEYPWEDEEEGY